jgi:secreted trypsin-like serine protease
VTTRTRSRKLALAAVTVAILLTGTATPATAATGDPQPDDTMTPMIIGGSPASQVYKGLGSLQYQRGDDPSWHTCAVNLWSPWHAVTNAHCVTSYPDGMPYDPARYKIRFNSTDRLAGGVVTGVKQIAVYPTWDWGAPGGDREGDLAVLRLTKPVWGAPTALPPVFRPWKVREGSARIVGWGITSLPHTGAAPQHLAEADTQIVDASHCAAAGIDPYEVCVLNQANPEVSACYGDSGGPVMTPAPVRGRWLLIGTASRETSSGCTGATVYTSVVAYRDWINQTIAGNYTQPKQKQKRPAVGGSLPAYRWAGCDIC